MTLPKVLQDQLDEIMPELTLEESKAMSPELVSAMSRSFHENYPVWAPQDQQVIALESEADEVFYGGQAGGGKTDLIIGLGLTEHLNTIIFRREATQLTGIIQRMTEILGDREGYNGTTRVWAPSIHNDPIQRVIEFGSVPNAGDETRYQGRPHDFIGFDEICNFMEQQYRFLKGWLRSARGVRTRVVCAGNPPTTSEGQWVREYWGPWLDKTHPDPAEPGELRFYTTNPATGEDMPCPDGSPIDVEGDIVTPKSRTFIPSTVEDNLFLEHTGYKSQLAALPEPLRSQMMQGDFSAGMEDNHWQVVPSAYVRAAMDRWKPREGAAKLTMIAVGVDVARGGRDKTVIVRRHEDDWCDEILAFPGPMTPDGPSAAALVIQYQRDAAVILVDVIGVGSSVYDFLRGNEAPVTPIGGAEKCEMRDSTGRFGFVNLRARLYWHIRELLMDENRVLALPNDSELISDLCAPRFTVVPGNKIKVESKEDIIKRIGRSPDKADALVYAYSDMGGSSMQNGQRKSWSKPIDYPDYGYV